MLSEKTNNSSGHAEEYYRSTPDAQAVLLAHARANARHREHRKYISGLKDELHPHAPIALSAEVNRPTIGRHKQMFRSVGELALHYKLSLPKPHDEWRLIREPFVGKINALPNLRGMALATNGIYVIVVCDQTAFIGHLEFFVGETSMDETLKQHAIAKKQTNKPSKPHFDISMFA